MVSLFHSFFSHASLRAGGVLCLCLLLVGGCASQKAGQDAPQLPAKHWLEEAPGVPVDKKDKVAAAIPNLYDAAKIFKFDDAVFLAIQQSPVLVNSAVDIEIKRLALTNAIWKYLPEPRMSLVVSNNITQYNMNTSSTPSDYARPKLQVGFDAAFPNPFMTYFEHQAQKLMVNLAISTHRKAVGEAIGKLGDLYLRLYAKKRILAEQEAIIPMTKEVADYWAQVEGVDGKQGVARNVAVQQVREAELKAEKTRMEETMLRTQLKILAGVAPKQQFTIDAQDVRGIVHNFDGRTLHWEDRWEKTEDSMLLRSQVKLQDYNIMVAWAQYVPDMTLQVNKTPPAGQYQPPHGDEDTFVHLNIDFPLIDWGRRYRSVQTARMQKAQAFHEQSRKRDDYSNNWLQSEQRVSLAETQVKLAENSLKVAELRLTEADIAYKEGIAEFPARASAREATANARIACYEAELELDLARLEWMKVATILQERYLGLPAIEE